MCTENESSSSFITTMPTLKEAHNNLRMSLGGKITKIKFDEDTRKLLTTQEQIHLHNVFMLSKPENSCPGRIRSPDYSDSRSSPCSVDTDEPIKYATQEMCLPDEDLIRIRLYQALIQHELEETDDDVIKMIIEATHMYLKNIITAIVSKIRGYKIRENNFQHAVGLSVANPWLRNTNNIIDGTQESNIEIDDEINIFQPLLRNTLESVQQESAFSYSCGVGNPTASCNKVSLKVLYEMIVENPHVINNHTIYTLITERILSRLDND